MALPRTNTSSHTNNVNIAAKLFAEYGDFIRAVVRYQAKNEDQADDIFQDFFLFLVSKPLPADVQNIKSYLYKAITNDIVDAARRVEKHKTRMNKYAECLNYSINKNRPENALIEKEQTNKMFKLIEKRLPHSEAKAITLRYRDKYNTKAVAEKMDVDKRTVSRYISVGFRKIRQFLATKQGD